MVTSFIGVYRHFQQCVRYNVEHGDHFYTMFYVITDTLLKVVNMFYAIANIVESGIKEHGDQFY
jgi:hypothetical protein